LADVVENESEIGEVDLAVEVGVAGDGGGEKEGVVIAVGGEAVAGDLAEVVDGGAEAVCATEGAEVGDDVGGGEGGDSGEEGENEGVGRGDETHAGTPVEA